MQNYIEVNVVKEVSELRNENAVTKTEKMAIRVSSIVSISKKYKTMTEVNLSNGNRLLVDETYANLSRFVRTNCKDEFVKLEVSKHYYGDKNTTVLFPNTTVLFRKSMIISVVERTKYRFIETTICGMRLAVNDSYEDMILALS